MDTQYEVLKHESEVVKSRLRTLHSSNEKKLLYPTHHTIESAIYDLDKRYIFGTLTASAKLQDRERNYIYYSSKLEPYYLGAVHLLLRKKIDYVPIQNLQKNIVYFLLFAGVFFSILGYYLGQLFVAPMRESLEKMNHFIQDTTHELNTPISTILTNIELIETFGKHTEHPNELKRIEIASKTLSRIYDDLTYLNLNHHYHRNIVPIEMSQLIKERMVYFTAMAEAKGLDVQLKITPHIVRNMDKNDALRLVDNLISNAIKYNKHKGLLEVVCYEAYLSVKDTGVGINPKDLKQILQRFKRANKSEGGFGIGLHIVSQVCESYGFELVISSEENEGTEVKIVWEK